MTSEVLCSDTMIDLQVNVLELITCYHLYIYFRVQFDNGRSLHCSDTKTKMGVKDLWTILSPVKSEVSLESLKGQTVAIDLSVWICETYSIKQMQGIVAKPHLRY